MAIQALDRAARTSASPERVKHYLEQLGRRENKKAGEAHDRIQAQMDATDALFRKYGTKESGPCSKLNLREMVPSKL